MAKRKAKRKAKVKRKSKPKSKPVRQLLIVTLSENGTPRRRAEIPWIKGQIFKLKHLAAHRDCKLWHLMPGWVIRISEAKGETANDN